MPSVLLVGAFGQANPGDEGILASFLPALAGWDTVATSSDPASTSRTRACDAVPSSDLREVASAAARADAVVFAGGTIFKTLHPTSGRAPVDLLRKGLALAAGVHILGKRVGMIGVGAGSLPGAYAKLLARQFAYRADLMVLRDEESASILRRAGVRPPLRVGADPAWTLFDDAVPARGPDEGILVALSHLAGDDSLADLLTGALRPLADGHPIRVQPWQVSATSGGDEELARRVADGTGAEILPPPRDLREARTLFRNQSLVVGLRFHALMAAAAAGTPFVAFGHEAKLLALARRLQQPRVLPDVLPESFAETIRSGLAIEPPQPHAIAAQLSAAHEGFRLMRLLLDGGSAVAPEDIQGLHLDPTPRAT